MNKHKHIYTITKATCPTATQNISINLKNREGAIKTANYGPLNPEEPNTEFWQKIADRWSVDIAEAQKSRCGNCAAFIKTPEMLNCIVNGMEDEDSAKQNAWDVVNKADLGYCELFDFKCAAARTCDAWITGGPIQ